MNKLPKAKIELKRIAQILKHFPQTIECGLHSGFPPCCVLYYMRVHLWKSHREMRKYTWAAGDLGFQHIPCPDCLKDKKIVKAKNCPKYSLCWHADECGGR
jgi:hypothetical protein